LGGALIALFVVWMRGRRTDLAERARPAAGAFDASGAAAMTVERMAARRTDAAFVGQRVLVEGATVERAQRSIGSSAIISFGSGRAAPAAFPSC
jgi:hypothetical protein